MTVDVDQPLHAIYLLLTVRYTDSTFIARRYITRLPAPTLTLHTLSGAVIPPGEEAGSRDVGWLRKGSSGQL